MPTPEFVVVGQGLAGTALAWALLRRGRSVPHAMLGRTTFTEAIVWHWLGRDPSPAERETFLNL